MRDGAEPPFSIVLAGHGVAGARRVDTADARTDEEPNEKGALRVFARAVHVDPDDPDYHFILGRALIEAGRLAEAIPALRKAIALHPEAAEYRLSLGHALWRAGRFEQAAEAFSEAARIRPADAAAWSGVGAARLAADGAAAALTAIEEALRLDQGLPDAHSNRGVALWKRGDTQGALAAFDTALRLDPELVPAQRNEGLALLELNRTQEALSALSTACQLQPQDAAIRVDIAEALVRLGGEQEAHAAFREALELSPTCLDERPQARDAFLALEATELRTDLPPQPSPRAAALVPLVAAQVLLATTLRRLLAMRRRAVAALGIALLAVGVYPLWHLTPVYVRHYLFVDDLGAVASTPLASDSDVHDRLMHVARRRGLVDVIDASSCQIVSLSRWRTITCRYNVGVALFPGVRRSMTFEAAVERFYVARDEPAGRERPSQDPPGADGY